MASTTGQQEEAAPFRERAVEHYGGRGIAKGTRHIVYVGALTLLGRSEDLRDAMEFALERRVPLGVIHETLLQTALFAGYPRAIHAFEVLSEILEARGLAPRHHRDRPPPRTSHAAFFKRRGRDVFREVYRGDADVVIDRIRGFHPDFVEWILDDAYGKVLGRPFLDLKCREILAVALLVILGLPRQLTPHLRAALRAGAKVRELAEVIGQLSVLVPDAAVKQGLVRLSRAATTL